MLNNQVWQPLPGTRQSEIFPYLRKPDLLSSNSCVIRTPEQIILIEAGALPAQTSDLSRILLECYREHPRPILLYLTHCHIDHSLQAGNYREMLAPASLWVAIQEEGAGYLIQGDRRKTIAELYGTTYPPMQPDIRLLAASDRTQEGVRIVSLLPDVELTLRGESVSTDLGHPLFMQCVSMGGGDEMEIYPVPGHSPDSVCLRIGEILFIGDLLAAVNPMVAGASGWNRDDYIRTLEEVLWLLDHKPIRFCYPGHGGVMAMEMTRDALRRLHQKACRLDEVVEMNEERLFQIMDYALELIDEAEEVFSSIAGRLLYVAYQLEQLGETEAAERCRTAMRMEEIDAQLLGFRNLCRSLDAGKIRRVEFTHSAFRIVEKIKSLFDPRPLSAILPQPLINRGTGLLLDFIGIATGWRNLEEFIPADLNALIADAVQAEQTDPHQDASIIDHADDHEKYLAALVLRIGHEPAARRTTLRFSPADGLPFVRIASARFSNTLLNFFEWLRQADLSSVNIATGMGGAGPCITIELPDGAGSLPTPGQEEKINSFDRRFLICGLVLKREAYGFRLTLADDATKEN